ncbi:MAG: hypothetical protein ABI758_03510 [Candidatus Woesebacteria bacterium]
MGPLLSYLALHTVVTFFSSIVCFFLPGILVVRALRLKSSSSLQFLLAMVVGIALFGTQGYIFGWIGMRSLTFVYLFFVCIVSFIHRFFIFSFLQKCKAELQSTSKSVVIIICLGVVLQSLQMFGNGLPIAGGTRFWRANSYDGVYHLGLIESMKRTFPPQEPSSSGQPVINYHYWSDFIISEQSLVFKTPAAFLFFQWWPILISLLTSVAVAQFVRFLTLTQSEKFRTNAVLFSLLFVLLGSDSGWIIMWIAHHTFSFAYPAIDNGATQFLNMPHTFGKLFFFVIGSLFLLWRKDRRWSLLSLLLFLSAICIGLKVYFGFALAIGWMGIFIYDFVRYILQERKSPKKLGRHVGTLGLLGLVYTLVIAAIYLPVNKGAGGLSWYPLEWPKLLINSNNMNWSELVNRIEVATYTKQTSKLFFYDIVLVLIGLISIHGSRAIGFILTKKTIRIFGIEGSVFFLIPVFVCTLLGFTTLQVSGGFNVFNFFAVSLSILCVTTALLCAQSIEKNKLLGFLLGIVLLLFCLPRSLYETVIMFANYSNGTDSISVSSQQMEAYTYLRSLPDTSVIAASLENSLESKSTYIAAFSGKQSYFAGKYLLETHNEPFKEKEQNLKLLFSESDVKTIQEKAMEYGITHLLIDSAQLQTPAERELFSQKEHAVFGNDHIFVYDVRTL